MAESASGCCSLGPAFDDSSSANGSRSIQMDLSGFLAAEGTRTIDWTAPHAQQGDSAPKGKGRSKGRPRGSVAKSIAVDAEPGEKGGEETRIDGQTVCRRMCVEGWRSLFHRQGTSSYQDRRMLVNGFSKTRNVTQDSLKRSSLTLRCFHQAPIDAVITVIYGKAGRVRERWVVAWLMHPN